MNEPTSAPNSCPKCGADLPSAATAGLCPRCLMAEAMEATQMDAEPATAQKMLSPEELAPHFPQLEILECLGRGGMGVVYKARQKSLNRFVALKLLAPERVGDPAFAERFEKEAQSLAALNHPHIVAVHDFGHVAAASDTQLPLYFLLMEFVDGVNLRQAMKVGRFTPEQALAVVPPVCEALQYAHEHGIVHRDIKPENLLLDKDGRVKIADFGVAKMLGEQDGGVGAVESQPAGTPQYMAPEQKEHRRTDHRADIYSLGVVLYELLTGELPAANLQPPSRRVQIDVRLDEIVLRALEAKPELRFATAAEFRTEVETLTRGAGVPPVQPAVAASGSSRFSRAAIVGACWAPFIFFALFRMSTGLRVEAGHSTEPPWWVLFPRVPLSLLAFAAPFGTTILGWVAVSQIRRSAGKLHGLGLAVFDGLLFPLLAIDALIISADLSGRTHIIGPGLTPGVTMAEQNNPGLVVLFLFAVIIVVDFLLVRAVWRAVNRPVNPPVSNEITRFSVITRIIGCSVLTAAVAGVLGLLFLRDNPDRGGISLFIAMAGGIVGAIAGSAREIASRKPPASSPRKLIAFGLAVAVATGVLIILLHFLRANLALRQENAAIAAAGAAGPEIERVEVGNDNAIVRQRRYDGEGMIVTFGPTTNRWTPGGLYLDTMFDITFGGSWVGHGANWVVKTRHGIHASYRLDGPPGPMLGKIVFHPGTPSPEADGSYVIGEFRPAKGEPLPIAVRLEKDSDKTVAPPTQSSSSGSPRQPESTRQPVPATTGASSVPQQIDFKVLRVENPPGTRDILLHFERDTNYGLAIEVWQDVTASPDGQVPKDKYRDARQRTWVGLNGGRVLGWTLPNEFTEAEADWQAKEMELKWKGSHPLPDGAVPEFATILNRAGWKYHLFAKVLREPGSPRPPAPAGALFTVEQRFIVPGDALVGLRLDQSSNDGARTQMGESLVFKTAANRATGFILRWHAYPAQQGKFGNQWILDLVDPDTGVIFHRVENRFAMPVKVTSPDVSPLPKASEAARLGDARMSASFQLLRAEDQIAPGAALTAWWDVFAEVGIVSPGSAATVPAFQMALKP